MNKILIIFLSLFTLNATVFAQGEDDRLKYIDKYKDIAITEMERAGVPASIKLAQGILESNSGKSYLARKANNHFGMKCGSQWKGKTVYREDDDYDANGKLQKSCFRAYRNVEACYVAHSDFLRDPRKAYRYGFLFRLDPQDYKRWASGLKKAGYATGANYHRKLISIIEKYELDQYDRVGDFLADGKKKKKKKKKDNTTDSPNPVESRPVLAGLTLVNDVKAVKTKEGETPAAIALRSDIKVNCILKYNEGLESANDGLDAGTIVYIQPKRSSYRGRKVFHKVEEGEMMYDISQQYGVKMKKLYKNNRMESGSQPAVGAQIKLRGKTKNPPRLRSQRVRDREDNEMDMEELDMEIEITTPEPKPEMEEMKEQPSYRPPSPPKKEVEEQPIQEPEFIKEDPPVIISPPTTSPTTTSPTSSVTPLYYNVMAGDTLYRIAKTNNTTVDKIMQLNNLTSNTISVGQRLRVR